MENSNNAPEKKSEEKVSQAYEAFNRGEIKKTSQSLKQETPLNNPGKSSESGNSKIFNNAFTLLPLGKHKEDISGIFKTELKDIFNDGKKA